MIRIQSTPAKIGLNINNATLSIKQPKAEVTIEQPKAKLNISTTPSRLSIEQSKAWSDLGFKSVLEIADEFAQHGKQGLLEGIARVAQEGNQLMMIENKGNPIQLQAKENSKGKVHEFIYGTLPKNHFRVELDYKPAQVNIGAERREPSINTIRNQPEYSYQPGGVEVYLRQRASLSFTYEPKVDRLG